MLIRIGEEKLAGILKISTRRVREACKNSKIAPAKYDLLSAITEFIEQSENKNKDFVTAKRLGEIFGITDKAIRDLVDRNILIKENDNFDLIANVKKYLDYQRANNDNAVYKREQTEYLKLKRQEKAKELHNAEDIKRAISKMLIAFRQKLLIIPKRESRVLAEMSSRVSIEELLEKTITEALEELSEYNFEAGEEDGDENS